MSRPTSNIEDCAVSCAATIEARKIRAHEVPIVLACLVNGLADHAGLTDHAVIDMIAKSSEMLRAAKSRSPKS